MGGVSADGDGIGGLELRLGILANPSTRETRMIKMIEKSWRNLTLGLPELLVIGWQISFEAGPVEFGDDTLGIPVCLDDCG
jgi:hypothetical protein